MAKIYETQKDYERDRLSNEAEDYRQTKYSLLSGSALLIGGGLAVPNKPVKWTALLAGIGGIVGSLFMHSKQKDAEAELKNLGPETVVLPPGVGQAKEQDCGCHMKHAMGMGAKSFTDRAAKTDVPPSKG